MPALVLVDAVAAVVVVSECQVVGEGGLYIRLHPYVWVCVRGCVCCKCVWHPFIFKNSHFNVLVRGT